MVVGEVAAETDVIIWEEVREDMLRLSVSAS